MDLLSHGRGRWFEPSIAHSECGEDALREIHATLDSKGVFIVVISEDELEAICDGADFYELLDEKLDRLQFEF